MASFAEAPPGNSQAGEKIFETKRAQRLATEKDAGHRQGPDLNGLFGRQSGITADYSYPAANKNMAVIWDESSLYNCLLNPKKVIPHERLSSISQLNAHKQTVQYNEYDIDQPKLQPQSFVTVGRGARRTNRIGAGSVIGSSGSEPFPEEKILTPSSPSRINLRRPVSPPIVISVDGASTTTPGRPSSSHPGSAYAPVRINNRSGWLDPRRLHNEDSQPLEAYTLYNLNKGYGRKHPRDLIDAYGNPENSSYEKFAKAQRLDGNGAASVAAAGEWRNSDEEEYVWEDMSPTLADRSRQNSTPPFGPSAGSFNVQTGFSSPNRSLMESDFVRHNWPREAQLRTADGTCPMVEDRIASQGSQARLMMKSLDGPSIHSESLSRRDSGKSTYILRQSTQQILSSRSQSRAAQMPPATRGTDSIDMNLTLRSLANTRADSLKMVASMMDRNSTQRHPLTPATLSPVHISQSLSLRTVPPTQSPIRTLDASEPSKSTLVQGTHHQPIFVPEQQYNVTKKKNSDSVELRHMPYQQSVFPRVNQHGKEQRIPLPVQSQEAYQSILTPAQMHLSSYSTGQSVNLQPKLGPGVAVPSDLPSSVATPAALHSTTDTSLVHANLLPPLYSGPLPASSHLLQNRTSSISGSPASAFSGLISSLMAHGLISLNSNSQAQEYLGADFDLDLLKVRHESVINSLYAILPRQCTTCGLRFKCQEEHSSHMDWHVTKNRIAKNRKQKPSRKWFVSAKEWLSGAETLGNDVVPGFLPTESITEKKEDKEVAVPADENQKVCALCGETFEDFYSDEMEEWMYKGAVYLNAPDGYTEGLDISQLGPIVHAKCRSESNESQQV